MVKATSICFDFFIIFVKKNERMDFKNQLKKIPKVFLNKYFITFAIFLVWILFFDKFNLLSRWETNRRVNKLENEIQYFKNEIDANKTKVIEMQSDEKTLEKYAREKYYLKKDSEDIFIIKENNE